MNDERTAGMNKKILSLCERIYARDGELPVIDRYRNDGSTTPQWAAWREWRLKNGLKVGFMDTRTRFTVPTEYPPVDIDTSLMSNRKTRLSERLEDA